MAGMRTTIHYIIEADELFVQTQQATYLCMDFGTVFGHYRFTCLHLFSYLFIYPSPVGASLIILPCFSKVFFVRVVRLYHVILFLRMSTY